MRPGQNKRLRGRSHNNNNNNRKGPNPLTRSFESNGPDVKIRGTAQHIAEKYLQLARDSQTSGDPVMAESYLQHAEHYYRVIAAAQQAQQQAMGLLPRPAQDIEEEDDGGEEDDRFASVADRLPQPPQPIPQPVQSPPSSQAQPPYQAQPQPYQAPQPNGGGERPPYQGGERQPHQGAGQRPWRENRNDQRGEPRNDQRGDQRDNRGSGNRFEPRADADGGERVATSGGQQPWRNERNDRSENRRPPRPEQAEVAESGGGLPAFITGSRPAPEATTGSAEPSEFEARPENGEDAGGYHLRPRRRRRGRPGAADGGFAGETENAASEGAPSDEPAPASD